MHTLFLMAEAASSDYGFTQFLQSFSRQGAACLGFAGGVALVLVVFSILGFDRRTTNKLTAERERNLQGQLVVKEQRIDELHKKIDSLLEKLADKHSSRK